MQCSESIEDVSIEPLIAVYHWLVVNKYVPGTAYQDDYDYHKTDNMTLTHNTVDVDIQVCQLKHIYRSISQCLESSIDSMTIKYTTPLYNKS